jgi:hypothetical protein
MDPHNAGHVELRQWGETLIPSVARPTMISATRYYGETFIVPTAVGEYMVPLLGPFSERECATLKTFMR